MSVNNCYLDCAQCNATGTFVIDPHNPSIGYCFAEKQAWVISDKRRIDELVTVCNKCLQSSCWQGLFMCQESQNAGTVELTVRELIALGREHPDYFIPKESK